MTTAHICGILTMSFAKGSFAKTYTFLQNGSLLTKWLFCFSCAGRHVMRTRAAACVTASRRHDKPPSRSRIDSGCSWISVALCPLLTVRRRIAIVRRTHDAVFVTCASASRWHDRLRRHVRGLVAVIRNLIATLCPSPDLLTSCRRDATPCALAPPRP